MTKVLTEEVNAFKVRTLNDKYVAIFMDATYIPLKRQTVSKEAIYIAIGIREDGTKEVLSYAIAPTESTYVCNELLQDIYSRGVHDVLLFITDGLKGMKDTIHQIYPKAKYQHCCVHVSRNIAHKVRVKDRKEICDDLSAVKRITRQSFGYDKNISRLKCTLRLSNSTRHTASSKLRLLL